jgi:hypothetical protein
MDIKLSSKEWSAMKALDPKGKGPREMLNARQIGSLVLRKKEENLEQEDIRVIRNAMRKPVREGLIEMPASHRGKYRISDRGRKKLAAGEKVFASKFARGDATDAAKAAGRDRQKAAGKKVAKKKVAKKKVAKKATKKATATKKKATKKPKPKIKVVDKSKDKKADKVKGANGENGKRKGPPSFKRRRPRSTYADKAE